jgi:hypothetical protein
MKTKLTLNIDEDVIQKAKILSKRQKQSISSIVENYLLKVIGFKTNSSFPKEETFTEKFRKKFSAKKVTPINYKQQWHKHLDEKYGK